MAWPQSTTGLPYTRTDHSTNSYYGAAASGGYPPKSPSTTSHGVHQQGTVYAGHQQYNTKVTEGSQFPPIGAYLHPQSPNVVSSPAKIHMTEPENTVDYKLMVERLGQYVKEQSQYTAIPTTGFTIMSLKRILGYIPNKTVAEDVIPKIYSALTHYSKEQPEMLGAMCSALNLLLDHIEDSNNNFSWEYRETVRMLKAYLKGEKPVRQKVPVAQVKSQQTSSQMSASQSDPRSNQAGSVTKPHPVVWQCPRWNSALMSANECVNCLKDEQVLAVLDVIKAYDKKFVRPEQAVRLLKDFNIYTDDLYLGEGKIRVSELLGRIDSLYGSSNCTWQKRAFLSRLFEYVREVKTARGAIHNDTNIVLMIGRSFMYKGNDEQQLIRWLSGNKLTADDFVTDEQREAIQKQRDQEIKEFVRLPSKTGKNDPSDDALRISVFERAKGSPEARRLLLQQGYGRQYSELLDDKYFTHHRKKYHQQELLPVTPPHASRVPIPQNYYPARPQGDQYYQQQQQHRMGYLPLNTSGRVSHHYQGSRPVQHQMPNAPKSYQYSAASSTPGYPVRNQSHVSPSNSHRDYQFTKAVTPMPMSKKTEQPEIKCILPNTPIPENSQVLWELSGEIREWKEIGRYLDLEETTLDEVDHKQGVKTADKRLQVLIEWVKEKGNKATWKALGDALIYAEQTLLYEKLEESYDQHRVK